MKPYDGGCAFPAEQTVTPDGWNQSFEPGMSLRDYFAAQALIGIYASPSKITKITGELIEEPMSHQDIANCAYEQADCMLNARKDESECIKLLSKIKKELKDISLNSNIYTNEYCASKALSIFSDIEKYENKIIR